jgi:hypothetical protein
VFKDAFTVGLRVLFARSHDKATKLFGRIVKIHDGNTDCVDVQTEPDGKKVEVSTIETAHAGDVVLAPEAEASASLYVAHTLPAKTSTAVLPVANQTGTRVIARG